MSHCDQPWTNRIAGPFRWPHSWARSLSPPPPRMSYSRTGSLAVEYIGAAARSCVIGGPLPALNAAGRMVTAILGAALEAVIGANTYRRSACAAVCTQHSTYV